MVQQIWAKLTARERFVLYGAVAMAIGWIVGFILANRNACDELGISGSFCRGASVNYFTGGSAFLFTFLGLLAAVAAVVALYLRAAPNVNFTWPVPYAQALLGICGAAVVLALLAVLIQFSNGLDGAPIFMWVADIIFVGGAAVMAFFAYQEWVASKTAA